MLYAILTSQDEAPLGYFDSPGAPTAEELADYLAEELGFSDRDAWIEAYGIEQLGFAPVH
ncbi:beta-lactoglobulin I [Burkholderia anthina]|uniref:beta-lactoglobulin I n=1 Tax=Burkholderia TaxID=32008 RepID=UPI000CE21313|nr:MULTISPECIES: beta-lactoglobulin I [Burkholderia]RQX81813.1 beta-lactoglobulin I [Burkholderia anthina]